MRDSSLLPSINTFYYQHSLLGYNYMGYSQSFFLNTIDKKIHMSKVHCVESNNTLRGVIPGLYAPIENVSLLTINNFERFISNNKIFIPIEAEYPNSPSYTCACFISLDPSDWS